MVLLVVRFKYLMVASTDRFRYRLQVVRYKYQLQRLCNATHNGRTLRAVIHIQLV
jgi:hypothetical protein